MNDSIVQPEKTVGLITNFEVNKLLLDQAQIDTKKREPSLIEKQVIGYLYQTPVHRFTKESTHNCLVALEPFNLTKAETLQLLNTAPIHEVEIHLIVEECAERLNLEQVKEMLDIIKRTLLSPKGEEEEG